MLNTAEKAVRKRMMRVRKAQWEGGMKRMVRMQWDIYFKRKFTPINHISFIATDA